MYDESDVVLLIEDDLDLARRFSEALSGAHIGVRCAAPGQVVRTALAWQPRLAIVDLGLFGSAGLDAIAELRRDPRTARLPVAVLSSRPKEAVTPNLDCQTVAVFWALHETPPEVLPDRVNDWLARSAGRPEAPADHERPRDAAGVAG